MLSLHGPILRTTPSVRVDCSHVCVHVCLFAFVGVLISVLFQVSSLLCVREFNDAPLSLFSGCCVFFFSPEHFHCVVMTVYFTETLVFIMLNVFFACLYVYMCVSDPGVIRPSSEVREVSAISRTLKLLNSLSCTRSLFFSLLSALRTSYFSPPLELLKSLSRSPVCSCSSLPGSYVVLVSRYSGTLFSPC
jgi:hypothetical protein